MLLRKALQFVLPALLGAASPVAHAFMIDEFTVSVNSTGGMNLTTSEPATLDVNTPGYSLGVKVLRGASTGALLGGSRDMFLSKFAIGGPGLGSDGFVYNQIVPSATLGNRWLSTLAQNGTSGVGTVRWDGNTVELPTTPTSGSTNPASPLFVFGPNNVNPNGLAPVNLTQSTIDPLVFDANAFALNLIFYYQNTMVTLDVWSNGGTRHGSLTRCGIPGDECPDTIVGESVLFFPFASFGGGLDFTQITAITMTVAIPTAPRLSVAPGSSSGIVVDSFETRRMLPEPASWLLAATGLAGVGWSRRRASRQT